MTSNNPESILPPTKDPEPFQQTGMRSSLLVLMCATHIGDVWVLDPGSGMPLENVVGAALAHFTLDRDPGIAGACQLTTAIAWDFHLDPKYMYDYRGDDLEKARAAASAKAD